jgi:hypothetical protein
MMSIILIFSTIFLLYLEALTDGYTFFSWKGKGTKYAIKAHDLQLITFAGYALLGKFFIPDGLLSWQTLFIIIGYILVRFGIFNIFYNTITDNTTQGTTSWFDRLTEKFPILNNTIIRMICLFGGAVILTLV